MPNRLLIPTATVILALAAGAGCAGTRGPSSSHAYAQPGGDEDVSYFYEALAPYGDWIRSDHYGLVWCPYDKQVDWRPYTDGEWIWTDYGWTWVADEEWGWATYHYGRWYDDPYDGWCWVPGRDWAPAWVAWRTGGGWVGWAPLPPELAWHDEVGLRWNYWDSMPGVEHYWWSFCRERDLPGPGVYRRLEPRYRAAVLLGGTHNITDYVYIDSHIRNRSLDVEPIRRAYGRNIATRRVNDLSAPPASRDQRLTRDSYNSYRPPLNRAAPGTSPNTVRAAWPGRTADEQATQVPQRVRDQQSQETRELNKREAADRERLQRDQRQESRQPPTGVEAEVLRRQQQNERKALDEQAARDQRVLRSRQEQKQQDQGAQPQAGNQPAGKGRNGNSRRDNK